MAKTQSQTGNIAIKKEEEDSKTTLLLHCVNNTTGSSNKITKQKPSKNNSTNVPLRQVKVEEEDCKPTLVLQSVRTTPGITKRKPSKNYTRILPALQVKVNEDTDTKSLLKPALEHSKLLKGQRASQEQINQFFDYVVNHGMNKAKAAREANISCSTSHYYYTEYKNDPEKKIPLLRNQRAPSQRFVTQEQVENLIRYIVDDKMPISKASAKANMGRDSGRQYYNKYLEDPDHAIPIPQPYLRYTQDQKNEFLGYVVNDKMSIQAASEKAKISVVTGKRYYHDYFKVQHPDIPTPSHIIIHRRYGQKKIKEFISYIVDDKMSIDVASMKANMEIAAAWRHYRQYLKRSQDGDPQCQNVTNKMK